METNMFQLIGNVWSGVFFPILIILTINLSFYFGTKLSNKFGKNETSDQIEKNYKFNSYRKLITKVPLNFMSGLIAYTLVILVTQGGEPIFRAFLTYFLIISVFIVIVRKLFSNDSLKIIIKKMFSFSIVGLQSFLLGFVSLQLYSLLIYGGTNLSIILSIIALAIITSGVVVAILLRIKEIKNFEVIIVDNIECEVGYCKLKEKTNQTDNN